MTIDTDRIARPTDEDGYYMVPCSRCREHYESALAGVRRQRQGALPVVRRRPTGSVDDELGATSIYAPIPMQRRRTTWTTFPTARPTIPIAGNSPLMRWAGGLGSQVYNSPKRA